MDHIPWGAGPEVETDAVEDDTVAALAAPCRNAFEASDDDGDADDADDDAEAGGPVHTALVEEFGDAMLSGLLGHTEQ